MRLPLQIVSSLFLIAMPCSTSRGDETRNEKYPLPYPPALGDGRTMVTVRSDELLRAPDSLREGVSVATTTPEIDFVFYPGQDYPGNPWSVWGDGTAAKGKYWSAIGDHLSPRGRALLYEYDAESKKLRVLVDVTRFLEDKGAIPEGCRYTPGKIHSRIELGRDGWLYYATHRGSPRTTTDEYGYRGDWILRTRPGGGETEIVSTFPIEKHAIPMSLLDPERLLFYGGTAPGEDASVQDVVFFVWDLEARRKIFESTGGPKRAAILSRSTGRVFFDGRVFDPRDPTKLERSERAPSVRSATSETKQGIVYGTTDQSAEIWAFDVKSEAIQKLGSGAVGAQEYITTIEVDPTGRYLYYVPGAHGGGAGDGSPVVQFDVETRRRKVLAFLHPYFFEKHGYTPDGTFSMALDDDGATLYITWNGMRKGQPRFWESCALTVVHIPSAERP